jgi:hypothetical protein
MTPEQRLDRLERVAISKEGQCWRVRARRRINILIQADEAGHSNR